MSNTVPHLSREPNQSPSPELESPSLEKKDRLAPQISDRDSLEDGSSTDTLIEAKSKGVAEMEYLADRINTKLLILVYGGFAVLAYVLSLSRFIPPPEHGPNG
jgi:SIT family siderophore-iron:H+ symporter-like MFS transporter